jgi:hypothetical protein
VRPAAAGEKLCVAEQRAVWRSPGSGEQTGKAEVASVFRVAAGPVSYYARFDGLAWHTRAWAMRTGPEGSPPARESTPHENGT